MLVATILMYLVLTLMFVVVACLVMYGLGLVYSIWKGAPYVSSGRRKAQQMLDLACVHEGMLVVDLGSGDGEICFAAARRGARAIGVEANPWLVWLSSVRASLNGAGDKVEFVRDDIWKYKLPTDVDLVTAYLLPGMQAPLWNKLRQELKTGTNVVSHAFRFPGVMCEKEDGVCFLYRV